MDFWQIVLDWLKNLFGLDLLLGAIEAGEPIPAQAYLNLIFSSVTLILGVLVAYKTVYLVLGVFGKSRKYPSQPKTNRYMFVTSARNEEKVIGNWIDSVRAMDYPQELIDIYVLCDNCTDKTEEIAKSKGAKVYAHVNPNERRKGFGLRHLFKTLKEEGMDIEKEYFAIVIFDADNVPAPKFLEKMNDAMVSGNFDECVGYRNTKNMAENWIAALCGMNAYAHVINGQRPRSMLNTNQEIYGCGLCLRSHLLKEGWNWTGLTEDVDMMVDLAAKGCRTGYAEDAVFYEEQPTKFKQFLRQQMRWTKGGLMSFNKYSWPITKSFFKKPSWGKYDMYWQFFPYALATFYFSLSYQVISLILLFAVGEHGYHWWSFANFILTTFGGIYVSMLVMDLLTIIREWKHFHLNIAKTFAYLLLFPLYNVVSLPINAVAVFMKVEWKAIEHHYVADPKDLVKEEEEKAQPHQKEN